MRRPLFTVALLLLSAFQLTSCHPYSIRDGYWKLTMHVESGLPDNMEVPDRLVAVRVGRDSTGEGEIAEISPVKSTSMQPDASGDPAVDTAKSSHPAYELRPMWADIRAKEDEDSRVQVEGADGFWRFIMWGRVKEYTYVQGVHFSATLRDPAKRLVLEGWWEMRWQRDF